jgi:hypothetical protein
MDKEIEKTQSTFVLATDFYANRIYNLVKEVKDMDDPDEFIIVTKVEQIEELELKLRQLNRRQKLGYIK